MKSKIKSIVVCLLCLVISFVTRPVAAQWLKLSLPFQGSMILFIASDLLLTFIAIRVLIKLAYNEPLAEFRIDRIHFKAKWFILALLLPLGVVAATILFTRGSFTLVNQPMDQLATVLVPGVLGAGLLASLTEEMIFRGVIMRVIEREWSLRIAFLVPSLLFAILHVLNGRLSLKECLLVIVAGTLTGVLFSMGAYFSGTIWCSFLYHFCWNLIVSSGIFMMSNVENPISPIQYVMQDKNILLTGGVFGIQSSVFAMVGYVVAIVFLLVQSVWKRNRSDI
ncbi:CPBP family intramembrane glutamic endopeptidase [Candidatus Enterococcus murrayae]|uniref:CPBP family intramembrane metalloprotease n=1 Tax=Candidatus Enterococcus murrayae TaxID=2815321 RepID=A0ABS3HG95_9ENTE|nr:type II CAAX endopeptidase family protein [Enterococcus sp. MJM16]MBO0451935.1 CPBP family intramembrane metalloprotease [Enterococcus sp. MJM16]